MSHKDKKWIRLSKEREEYHNNPNFVSACKGIEAEYNDYIRLYPYAPLCNWYMKDFALKFQLKVIESYYKWNDLPNNVNDVKCKYDPSGPWYLTTEALPFPYKLPHESAWARFFRWWKEEAKPVIEEIRSVVSTASEMYTKLTTLYGGFAALVAV